MACIDSGLGGDSARLLGPKSQWAGLPGTNPSTQGIGSGDTRFPGPNLSTQREQFQASGLSPACGLAPCYLCSLWGQKHYWSRKWDSAMPSFINYLVPEMKGFLIRFQTTENWEGLQTFGGPEYNSEYINRLESWARDNKMNLNADKCEMLRLGKN